ncbi:MAG: RNA 3'-terminal phosphate cyclase [Janthinobacterium lividum]
MITGQPFRISRIRANRPKPGLMRQHLVAVQAAARISGATVSHAETGSAELSFVPGQIAARDYEFAIGTAGRCTLVLQTLALALLHADGPSTVRIKGGTHNAMAPPLQFLQRATVPCSRRWSPGSTSAWSAMASIRPAAVSRRLRSHHARAWRRSRCWTGARVIAPMRKPSWPGFPPVSASVSWPASARRWGGRRRSCN